MITTAEPIHTAAVNGHAVRYFRGATDAPDMPWHAHDDLLNSLALSRSPRRHLRAALLRQFGDVCRTVEVDGDPILIAPHYVAQGLIGAAQEAGGDITTTPDLVEREYVRGGVAAMKVLTAGLSPEESFDFTIRAYHGPTGREGAAP